MGESYLERLERIKKTLQQQIDLGVGWHEHQLSREQIQFLLDIADKFATLGVHNGEGKELDLNNVVKDYILVERKEFQELKKAVIEMMRLIKDM